MYLVLRWWQLAVREAGANPLVVLNAEVATDLARGLVATTRLMRDVWGRQEDTGPARHSFKITLSPPQSPGSLSASVWEKVHRWPPMSRTTYCRSP